MIRPRSPREVSAAWLATGPVGHLVAGVLDWAEVIGRYALRRWFPKLQR